MHSSDDEGGDHVHFVDPSMDGHCVACIGARRIYCLDGSLAEDGKGDVNDYSLGSCQPSWAYCTWGGRDDFISHMNFRECEYTPVKSPATGETFTKDMIELEISDEMAQIVKDGQKHTMLDFLFMPNQF